ncbi:MAG TPA: S-layer homology domain-containing protein [Candidatus Paenibacillus intestinavium]|nr:S-layer homology domain-containing protein [Candidatus Paenibacillus intestinavium]
MAALLGRVSKIAMNEVNISYTDVSSTNWANKEIEEVSKMGLMVGYTDRSFRPEQVITHAEMVVILSSWLGNDQSRGDSLPNTEGHWAQSAMELVKAAGIISGDTHWAFEQIQEASIDHEHKDATE